MVSEFKFFHTNPHKNRCRLQVGSSFIFKGRYCIVTGMYMHHFKYIVQENDMVGYMTYSFYLTTQSAIGRQLLK